MSTPRPPRPPSPTSSRPLTERSQSRNNTLAIRVVPYSPPRPSDDDGDGDLEGRSATSSSATSALQGPKSRLDRLDEPSPSRNDFWEKAPTSPASTLSPSSSAASLATLRGQFVSGSIGSAAPVGRSAWAGPLAHSKPPYASNIGQIHASAPSQQDPPQQHPQQHLQQDGSGPETYSASESRPTSPAVSRRRNFITIHSDKTFSLLPPQSRQQLIGGSLGSARASFSTTSVSSDPFTDDAPSSPVTTLPEGSRSISPCTLASSPTPTLRHLIPENPHRPKSPLPPASGSTSAAASAPAVPPASSSSPWNYRIVGGLRKVPKTPDLKRSQTTGSSPPKAPTPLAAKPSFHSTGSESTASDTTNYKTYGSPSPDGADNVSLAASSDDSNYLLLGASSSPTPYPENLPPSSPASEDNYIVHQDSSPSPVVRVKSRRPDKEYSQDSLIVPPLRPSKKSSLERLGYLTSRSRESLRHVGSLASISSILSQENTQSLLSKPAALYLQGGAITLLTLQHDAWAATSSTSSPGSATRGTSHMLAHPHQWSSQLSTVASESDGERESDEAGSSRAGSPASYPARWSSGFLSNHSRQMASFSSASGLDGQSSGHSRSPSDTLDRPYPAHVRHGHRDAHLVRDQDEHGDGLTELQALQQRPSRTRLSTFFSNLSDRNLHSSASSRANSFSSSSLPAWAQLYYGSGEKRRFLAPSSESMFSEYNDSRPPSSFRSRSPSIDHFPPNIYSQRRRPREVGRGHAHQSSTASVGIMPLPPLGSGMGLRKKTSSVWSPHLRHDQRASRYSRYSIWEPPSDTWSSDGGFLGRRNVQVILFIVGFALPFAWMIAAVLPLPPNPDSEKLAGAATRVETKASTREVRGGDSSGARWWRRLNRYMSIIGFLVIGAVVTLAVLGVSQRLGSPS